MSDRAFQTSRDVVIGLADGAIIVSSVLAGLTGADQPSELLVNAGGVTAVCGALAFAFSRYASGKEAEKDFIARGSEPDPGELTRKLGLDEAFTTAAGSGMKADQKLWKESVSTSDSNDNTAYPSNAFAIGLSFFAAGLLALASYFLHNATEAFLITITAVSILLLICGLIKARLAGRNALAGAAIQWTTGAAAIGLCFLMGRLLG